MGPVNAHARLIGLCAKCAVQTLVALIGGKPAPMFPPYLNGYEHLTIAGLQKRSMCRSIYKATALTRSRFDIAKYVRCNRARQDCHKARALHQHCKKKSREVVARRNQRPRWNDRRNRARDARWPRYWRTRGLNYS